jgi:DNA-binding transcriptional ArsR family regulator
MKVFISANVCRYEYLNKYNETTKTCRLLTISESKKPMPDRKVVAKELSELFKLMSNPDRIRIIEELSSSEKDVNTLIEALDLPGPRVSQHLSLLRAHRIVEERRDGRHHYYHLVQPEMATWVVGGLDFVEGRLIAVSKTTIANARKLWSPKKIRQS